MNSYFEGQGLKLEYETFGSGKTPLLAFHGFGTDSNLFRVLEPSLGKRYTVYSLNLPFHGLSQVDAKTISHGVTQRQMKKFIEDFLVHIKAADFSLLGYSIGGKIVLELITLFPG